jgi:hypothetical protein
MTIITTVLHKLLASPYRVLLGEHPKCTTHGHLKMYQGSVGT